MVKDDKKINPVFEYVRFGSIAYHREYVSKEQIQQAIAEQVEDNLSKRPHRLLGSILREKGWLTKEQEKSILEEMGMGE
jgi:tRNA(Glu) U13 pseudouridine synthase TruD